MQQYQREMDQISGLLRERLAIIDGLLADYNKEFDNTAAALKAVKGPKSKALFADELDRIEQAIASLQTEQVIILGRLEKRSVTDQQIETAFKFAAAMVDDWDRISNDPESRRQFIQMIDAQLMLIVVDGNLKGLLEAKLPGGYILDFDRLCFENSTKICKIRKTIELGHSHDAKY